MDLVWVEDRLHGFLLTWNGSWGSGLQDVGWIQQLPEPYLVADVQESPLYKERPVCGLGARAKDHGWPHVSCKMELSLHRTKVANVVHFHVAATGVELGKLLGSTSCMQAG